MCFVYKVLLTIFGCFAMGSAVLLFLGLDCSYILQGLE